MTIFDWFRISADYYRTHPPKEATAKAGKNTLHSALSQVDSRVGGWNIYEDDWDLLIVLDACRADLFREVAPQFDFVPDKIETRRSVGPATRNWMVRTFAEEYRSKVEDTDYIVANPYSEVLLEPSQFNYFDEVHRYAWDEDLGTVRPRPVTERAIDVGRKSDSERLLVHYLPPHFPSIPDNLGYNLDRDEFENFIGQTGAHEGVWDAARDGEISRERIWEAYSANLNHVLEDVELLLNNIDAENAILTSDHGNAMGEWWTWGHPPGVYHPKCRTVPFVRVEASDNKSLKPSLDRESVREENDVDSSVEKRLEDLGYT